MIKRILAELRSSNFIEKSQVHQALRIIAATILVITTIIACFLFERRQRQIFKHYKDVDKFDQIKSILVKGERT